MPPYKELPSPPEKISSGAILARMIDGIGFRYQVATDGLTDNEVNFLPTDGSMNMIELLEHIYKVLFWGYRACDDQLEYRKDLATYDDYRNETLEICQAFKKKLLTMSDEDLNQISIFLKRKNKTFTFWYLINGPIADVLTHIGQINSWRRIAGNPVAKISPFDGKKF